MNWLPDWSFFSTKSEIICLICVLYLRWWWTRIYFGTLCRIYMEHFGVRDRNNCEWLFPSLLDLWETQWGDMGDAGMGVWDGACALGNANGCRVMLLCMRPNTGIVIWTCWEPLSWPWCRIYISDYCWIPSSGWQKVTPLKMKIFVMTRGAVFVTARPFTQPTNYRIKLSAIIHLVWIGTELKLWYLRSTPDTFIPLQ